MFATHTTTLISSPISSSASAHGSAQRSSTHADPKVLPEKATYTNVFPSQFATEDQFRRQGAVAFAVSLLIDAGPQSLVPLTPEQWANEPAPKVHLTACETRVAELASRGFTLRVVASKLFISAKTADFHLQSVYRKLGVHNRTEFAAAFYRLQQAA
jgi:DNA-binding CsgD family transcriptional regulator